MFAISCGLQYTLVTLFLYVTVAYASGAQQKII